VGLKTFPILLSSSVSRETQSLLLHELVGKMWHLVRRRVTVKPGSHLWDRLNTSERSTSISTRKRNKFRFSCSWAYAYFTCVTLISQAWIRLKCLLVFDVVMISKEDGAFCLNLRSHQLWIFAKKKSKWLIVCFSVLHNVQVSLLEIPAWNRFKLVGTMLYWKAVNLEWLVIKSGNAYTLWTFSLVKL